VGQEQNENNKMFFIVFFRQEITAYFLEEIFWIVWFGALVENYVCQRMPYRAVGNILRGSCPVTGRYTITLLYVR
jgi:hypothetical protein